MNNYYTYAYLREDRTPYYIGKGKGNRAYKKYRTGTRPPRDKNRIIFLKQNLTEEEAFKHEVYMIAVFGRKDLGTGILHNRTDGGEGSSGSIRSLETREKLSATNKGKTFSLETREKLSAALKGKKRPIDVVKKIKLTLNERKCGVGENNGRAKTYKITFDDGNSIIIKSLKTWSKENVYNPDCLRNLHNGRQVRKHKNIVSVEIVKA